MKLPRINDGRFRVSNSGPMLTVEMSREHATPLYACWQFMSDEPAPDDVIDVVRERIAALLAAAEKEASEVS